jgi:hypothetical protein
MEKFGYSHTIWPFNKLQTILTAQSGRDVEKCVRELESERRKAEVFHGFDVSLTDNAFRSRIESIEPSILHHNYDFSGVDRYGVTRVRDEEPRGNDNDGVRGFTVITGQQ